MHLETEISELSPTAAIFIIRGRFSLGGQMSVTQGQITGLLDKGMKKLLVDLSDAEYIDSAALGLLVHTNGELLSRGGELRVAAPNDRVLGLLRMTHTDSMLKIYADRQSALEGFDA